MLLLPCLMLGVFCSGCRSKKPAFSINAFDFGQGVVPETSTRDVVTVTNTGSTAAYISATVSGNSSLKLDSGLSCGTSLIAGGSCSIVASFTPTTSGAVTGTLTVSLSGSINSQQNISLKGTGVQLSGGQSLVTSTANPLTALFSYRPTAKPELLWPVWYLQGRRSLLVAST